MYVQVRKPVGDVAPVNEVVHVVLWEPKDIGLGLQVTDSVGVARPVIVMTLELGDVADAYENCAGLFPLSVMLNIVPLGTKTKEIVCVPGVSAPVVYETSKKPLLSQ